MHFISGYEEMFNLTGKRSLQLRLKKTGIILKPGQWMVLRTAAREGPKTVAKEGLLMCKYNRVGQGRGDHLGQGPFN